MALGQKGGTLLVNMYERISREKYEEKKLLL